MEIIDKTALHLGGFGCRKMAVLAKSGAPSAQLPEVSLDQLQRKKFGYKTIIEDMSVGGTL